MRIELYNKKTGEIIRGNNYLVHKTGEVYQDIGGSHAFELFLREDIGWRVVEDQAQDGAAP